ncbi:MAG: energy transducer TonB [Comamonadaceae bacterium]
MVQRTPTVQRNTLVVVGVLLIHGAGLWLFQSGLLEKMAEVVVPVQLISSSIDVNRAPLKPLASPITNPIATPIATPPAPPVKATKPSPSPLTPQPQPPALQPSPNQTATNPNTPLTTTPATASATITATSPATTSPAPAKVELPTHVAAYLQNPKPDYPALSVRRGEQGQVVLNVLIGVEGKAQKAEIVKSSGFERLDAAALATVLRWRYVPGKRGGVPEEMWFKVPLAFVLD